MSRQQGDIISQLWSDTTPIYIYTMYYILCIDTLHVFSALSRVMLSILSKLILGLHDLMEVRTEVGSSMNMEIQYWSGQYLPVGSKKAMSPSFMTQQRFYLGGRHRPRT